MKKLLAFTILFLTCSFNAQAIEANKAQSFIENLTNEGIKELVNTNASKNEKQEKFKELFDKNLDLDFIGRFVLGRYWRSASPQQKKDFLSAYKNYNVRTWSERFDEFKGKNFKFLGTTPSNSKNQIFVDTQVDLGGGQKPAKVVWRVMEQKNGAYKVVDIIIEDVSLAISARTEYSAFIKNNKGGIDALIKKLEN